MIQIKLNGIGDTRENISVGHSSGELHYKLLILFQKAGFSSRSYDISPYAMQTQNIRGEKFVILNPFEKVITSQSPTCFGKPRATSQPEARPRSVLAKKHTIVFSESRRGTKGTNGKGMFLLPEVNKNVMLHQRTYVTDKIKLQFQTRS